MLASVYAAAVLLTCAVGSVPRLAPAGEPVAASYVRTPWFFDCSNHPEWSAFRQYFVDFRVRFALGGGENPDLVDDVQDILMQANQLGKKYEANFVKWASSWHIFHLCNDSRQEEVPDELRDDFCFYGFVVVQWLGIFGFKHFGHVPGMAEWAHNARGFLNDASKFNAMHFLESSGWPVKLVELAQTLSIAHLGTAMYRPARDAGLPGLTSLQGRPRQSPEHTQVRGATRIRAVAISYHTALVREPLSLWMRALRHRFQVDASVHVLDATARTSEDIRALHSHCKFIDGAWCASDERLLRLNEFFESTLLSCHTGDHKTKHHFMTDAESYYQLFVDMFDKDSEMRSADLFMCGEPVFFCRLLSHFGQPVVGYISTPISVYVNAADRSRWYQTFHDLALDPRHFFAATTPVFAEWITYATGIVLPVVRPVTLYTEATYWPVRAREVLLLRTVSLFWDSECVLNHFAKETARAGAAGGANWTGRTPMLFVESTSLSGQERVGYETFAKFRAAVIYPYAFSQFWFYELYSMAVPLYMPSRETLPLFVNQDYAVCPDFEGHRPGHVPSAVHPYSPFDADDWDAMTYWTGFTDYLLTPHVQYFESLPQLLLKLEVNNHRDLSREMQRAHVEHVGESTTFWTSVLDAVASIRGLAPGGGRREDDSEPAFDPHSDELRDLSTRQPCGGSPARPDGHHRKANDGETNQQHPSEYHFDADRAADVSSSHWWVQLRRVAANPEVKLWPRNCCGEAFGHRLWFLIGNSSRVEDAVDCATVEVVDSEMISNVCQGTGEFFFVEARSVGGWGYQDAGVAVLMLPEVRVLSVD